MLLRILPVAALAASACVGHRPPPASIDRQQSVPGGVVADASYALALANILARGAWDDWVPGSVPFVIVYREEQWVFRSGAPLPGYDPHAFSSTLGPVYRAPSWTKYDGLHVTFAPPRFFAQTDRSDGALTFTIAAPSLAPFPISDWATVFAHEYFHTFQMTDARWATDFPLIAPPHRHQLAELSRSDPVMRDTISQELDLYASRLRPGEPPRCDDLDALARIRGNRAAFLNAIDPQLPRAEWALERVEGIARYVEERAYDMKDVTQIFRSREPTWEPAPDEKSLKRRLGVEGGEYYYATGYALARILDACNPGWKKSFAGRNLFDLIRAAPST
jgi:hypothetical protein